MLHSVVSSVSTTRQNTPEEATWGLLFSSRSNMVVGGHLAEYPDEFISFPAFTSTPFNAASRPNGQMPPPALQQQDNVGKF